jgi:hypothetical protein
VAGATFPPRAVQVVKAAGAGCGWARRCPLRGCGRAESAWGLRALRSCAPRRPSGPGKVGLGEGQLWIPPSTAAPPGARSLRPSRRQPTACPRAGKKPHPPARNAGLPGRRRAAGGGRRGAAGKVGESAARPALPGLPGPRRPGHLATSPTFPAGHTDRGTSGSQGLRASRGWGRGGSPGQAAPVPSARPQAPAPRLAGGGRPSCFPTPLPAAGFGARVGSRGLISRGAGVWPAGPRVVSHTRCSPSPGAQRGPSPSCAPPWAGVSLAWHEDRGVPREGLKPGVVAEGGKQRRAETPLGELRLTLTSPSPASTCSKLVEGPGCAPGSPSVRPSSEGPLGLPIPLAPLWT